ncbi:MAG: hypothetical protein QM687_12050 [Ferruginibacter sp.]
MLQQISWSEYLAFIVLSALIYYAYVLFVYYRHDFLSTGKSKQTVPSPALNFHATASQPSNAGSNHADYLPKPADAAPSQMVQSFTDEIKAYLEEAGNNETPKDVILQCLNVIAGKYPPLIDSDYKDAFVQLIINEAGMNCAVSLSESEVRRIWGGA